MKRAILEFLAIAGVFATVVALALFWHGVTGA